MRRRKKPKDTGLKAASAAPVVQKPSTQPPVEPQKPPTPPLPPRDDDVTVARGARIATLLAKTDAEGRLARCVDTLLGADELPWNPFPTLARLARREEMALSLELAASPGDAREAKQRQRGLWREGTSGTAPSTLDPQLMKLGRSGAGWRLLMPMLDGESVKASAAALASSQLLAGAAAHPVSTTEGSFSVRSVCSLLGGHAFAGRLVAHPRTIFVREHVQVSSRKASRLEAAILAFAEHICAAAVSLHACKEHFVQRLEVYTGDDDAFVDDVGQAGESGNASSNARGTPERFSIAEMEARSPALARALHASAMAQLPVELHAIVCAPIFAGEADVGLPPRWEYVTVNKDYCFFFETTQAAIANKVPGSRGAPSTTSSRRGAALGFRDGGDFEIERPPTPPRSFSQQPFQLQSLYDSVFMSDADALWYINFRENQPAPDEAGVAPSLENAFRHPEEALARFHTFLGEQVCRFLYRCDYPNLAETLCLLIPKIERDEREALLAELHSFFTSDAATLGHLAHQSYVIQCGLEAMDAPSVPEPKRLFAAAVLSAQLGHVASQFDEFCEAAHWADLQPLKAHGRGLLRSLRDGGDRLRRGAKAGRQLGRLRRMCDAVSDVLADALIACCPRISALVRERWDAAKAEVPLALQPPAMKVRVVVVPEERLRQRKMRTYPPAILRESILLQYAVDTQLDRALNACFEDIVSARVLRGGENPMHSALYRIKAASQFFELWKESDKSLQAAIPNEPTVVQLVQSVCRVPPPTVETAQKAAFKRPARAGKARWQYVASESGLDADGLTGVEHKEGAEEAVYGFRSSLIVPDRIQLHRLRRELGDLMPSGATMTVQDYESVVYAAFCGENMLLHGSFLRLEELQAVSVREDHFIYGKAEKQAVIIHSQRVIQGFLRLHHKTPHLAAALVLGEARHAVADVLSDQKEMLNEVSRAVVAGEQVQLLAYVLVREIGMPRYISLTKSFHLVFFVSDAKGQPGRPQRSLNARASEADASSSRSWPARGMQVFDSVFLSRAHIDSCLRAEVTRVEAVLEGGGKAVGWRRKKWAEHLEARAAVAVRDGATLLGGRLLLQLHLMSDERKLLPGVVRLLQSAAARLDELAWLNCNMQGVLECTRLEEHKLKTDQRVVIGMFEGYRKQVLDNLAGDACCNFEALRALLQASLQWVVEQLREQGVITEPCIEVLETVDDYLRCIEVSIAAQVALNDTPLSAALAAAAKGEAQDQLSEG